MCPARKHRGRGDERLARASRRVDLGCRIADATGARWRMLGGGRGGSGGGADRQAARDDFRPAAARAALLLDLRLRRSPAERSRPLDRVGARDSVRHRDNQNCAAAVVRRLQKRHLQLRIVGAPDGFPRARRHLSLRLLPRLSARLPLRAVARGNYCERDRRGRRDAPDDRRGAGDWWPTSCSPC